MGETAEDGQPTGVNRLQNMVISRLEEINTYMKVTGAAKIIRRYFAMNAFDGAMTSLGVIIGAYLSNLSDSRSIIGVIITSGIAMMVSGFSGTYMTESAERNHSLNELEDAMLVDLEDTVYGRAGRFVSIFAAFVDGLAPILASIPSLIPFFLSPSMISLQTAFLMAALASLVTLFLLGVYLGKISGENLFYSGAKMVLSGLMVALIALLLNVH